jgi:hypothetical protein
MHLNDQECWAIWLTFDADIRLDDQGNPIARQAAIDHIQRWLLEPGVPLHVLDGLADRLIKANQLAQKVAKLLASRRELN